jgi:hypothetical protein
MEITKPTTSLRISDLSGGIYCVKVVGENGILMKKFVKE